jgi:high frequency lysogenization protein
MPKTDHDRVVAMAGLFQATGLVSEIAHRGHANSHDFQTCLSSLFKIEAATSEEVYGGIANLRTGLCSLAEHLRDPTSLETSRYIIALLVLERKLSSQPQRLRSIRQDIEAIMEQLPRLSLNHDTIVADLSEIYSSLISPLSPRVIVYGDPACLSVSDNSNRIRALLLAGIRAAFLWRQSGGGRLTLLFRRRALLQETRRLLSSLAA